MPPPVPFKQAGFMFFGLAVGQLIVFGVLNKYGKPDPDLNIVHSSFNVLAFVYGVNMLGWFIAGIVVNYRRGEKHTRVEMIVTSAKDEEDDD